MDNPGAALSIALIAAAGGIIAATAFGGLSSILQRPGYYPYHILTCVVLSILALMLSMYFGGRGIAYGAGRGPSSPFNIQAIFGILGIFFVCGAAVFSAMGAIRQHKDQAQEQMNVTARITALETQLAELSKRLEPATSNPSPAPSPSPAPNPAPATPPAATTTNATDQPGTKP